MTGSSCGHRERSNSLDSIRVIFHVNLLGRGGIPRFIDYTEIQTVLIPNPCILHLYKVKEVYSK